MRKNGVPSVYIVDFMRESNMGWNFFLGFLGVTLNGPSGRINEPNYNKRSLKKPVTNRDCK